MAYSPNDEELVALLAVELDGTVLWDAPVPGSQDPRVAFDRDAGVGLMIFDRGLQWLGPDGRPVGLPERYGRFTNVTGEVAVTADGFLTMFAEFGGPLHFHRVGRVAEPPQMNVFDERGGTTPEHVIDEAGHASFIATSATDGSYGAIHRVGDSGPPELVADLGDRGRVVGFQSGPDGQFFVLRVAPPPARSLLVLEELDRAGALLGRNEFPSELAGSQLLRLGESLIFATRASTGDETLVCADGRDPSSFSTTTYTSERVTAGSPPRMTRVPRGFAVTWGTRGTVSGTQSMLQVYDCCVPE